MDIAKENKGTETLSSSPAKSAPVAIPLWRRLGGLPGRLLRGLWTMNHETQAGLIVSASFLCLVGVVLYSKMDAQQAVAIPAEYQEFIKPGTDNEIGVPDEPKAVQSTGVLPTAGALRLNDIPGFGRGVIQASATLPGDANHNSTSSSPATHTNGAAPHRDSKAKSGSKAASKNNTTDLNTSPTIDGMNPDLSADDEGGATTQTPDAHKGGDPSKAAPVSPVKKAQPDGQSSNGLAKNNASNMTSKDNPLPQKKPDDLLGKNNDSSLWSNSLTNSKEKTQKASDIDALLKKQAAAAQGQSVDMQNSTHGPTSDLSGGLGKANAQGANILDVGSAHPLPQGQASADIKTNSLSHSNDLHALPANPTAGLNKDPLHSGGSVLDKPGIKSPVLSTGVSVTPNPLTPTSTGSATFLGSANTAGSATSGAGLGTGVSAGASINSTIPDHLQTKPPSQPPASTDVHLSAPVPAAIGGASATLPVAAHDRNAFGAKPTASFAATMTPAIPPRRPDPIQVAQGPTAGLAPRTGDRLSSIPPVGAAATVSTAAVSVPMPPTAAALVTPRVGSWDEEIYHCATGDSLGQISQHYYSTDKYSRALLLFNRDRQPASAGLQQEPPALSTGATLYIPPARVLDEKYPDVITGSPAPKTTATGSSSYSPAAATSSASARTYRVGPGTETFFEIAQRTLGDGDRRWNEIWRLNPRYGALERIPVGAVLYLPTDARVDAAHIPQ